MLAFYLNIELFLILVLFIQTSLNLWLSPNSIRNSTELKIYVYILFLNKMAYLIFKKSDALYYFFHSAAPLGIILSLWWRGKNQFDRIIFSLLLGTLFVWYLSNDLLYFILYTVAIMTLINKAINLASGPSSTMKKSFLPIILSIDLFFAYISVILNIEEIDWSRSFYIYYLKYLIMPFSLITLILIYDNNRRHSTY